jgi:hypothetical protein
MSALVTQAEIDSLLEAAGLPTSTSPVDDAATVPPPPFGAHGFELYESYVDARAYLRAPLPISPSLLAHPLY